MKPTIKEEKVLTTENVELLRRISGYLPHSTDLPTNDLLYRTPAQVLREQADYLEKKDKDINDFRILLNKL